VTQFIVLKQRSYAEIEARYACSHSVRELRFRTIADGRPAYVTQCIQCGHTSQAIALKAALASAVGRLIPPYDDNLEASWRERKSTEYSEAFQSLRPQLQQEYEAYLASPKWRAMRQAVLSRSQGVCELCEKEAATDIHHVTYIRLGNELLTDLRAVCRTCHEYLHTPAAA
jgi:hypothetical protein